MTIKNQKIANRWNSVMNDIGCEHLTIGTRLSELEDKKTYYDIEDGINIDWMLSEANYWLSCYFENGNVRHDDKYLDSENYKIWVSETGRLKRLIARLEEILNELGSVMIVTW